MSEIPNKTTVMTTKAILINILEFDQRHRHESQTEYLPPPPTARESLHTDHKTSRQDHSPCHSLHRPSPWATPRHSDRRTWPRRHSQYDTFDNAHPALHRNRLPAQPFAHGGRDFSNRVFCTRCHVVDHVFADRCDFLAHEIRRVFSSRHRFVHHVAKHRTGEREFANHRPHTDQRKANKYTPEISRTSMTLVI